MISNLCDTTNTRLGSLTRVLESEFDDPDKRRMVMDVLKEISGLDKNDIFLVTRNWYMNPRTWKSFSVSQGSRRRKCNLDGRDNGGKKFAGKGCLGVLDGMYLDVRVHVEDRARYRTCKGSIFVNVLGMCDRDMPFIYVIAGWDCSAADGRVLQYAITQPTGLKIEAIIIWLIVDTTTAKGFCHHTKGSLSSQRMGVRKQHATKS
ncbi:UNVERIFIED_CONTAM: hypothetical protein Scaly_3017800 [Sesamum calycinum]|uniref:Transposase n=1 Tax=Sesamum calycinum TaxID=2727403 RepID=A0AAW2KCK2_9LAMI